LSIFTTLVERPLAHGIVDGDDRLRQRSRIAVELLSDIASCTQEEGSSTVTMALCQQSQPSAWTGIDCARLSEQAMLTHVASTAARKAHSRIAHTAIHVGWAR